MGCASFYFTYYKKIPSEKEEAPQHLLILHNTASTANTAFLAHNAYTAYTANTAFNAFTAYTAYTT